jgi:hypothetical protein
VYQIANGPHVALVRWQRIRGNHDRLRVSAWGGHDWSTDDGTVAHGSRLGETTSIG